MEDVEVVIAPQRWLDVPDEDLSPAERTRAASFHHDRDRRAFVYRRTLLRRAVARHLEVPGELVRIEHRCPACGERSHGAPLVIAPRRLALSTSSAGNRVAIALAPPPLAVGIDLVSLDQGDGLAEAMSIVLNEAERDSFASVGGAAQRHALEQAFAVKEAVLKATGRGLADGLHGVHAIPRFVPPDRRRWRLELLSGDGYVGALAAAG